MLQGADAVAYLVEDPFHLDLQVGEGFHDVLVCLGAGSFGVQLGLGNDLIVEAAQDRAPSGLRSSRGLTGWCGWPLPEPELKCGLARPAAFPPA